MLKELSGYQNLGTPSYYWELLHMLQGEGSWTKRDVREYFFNRIIDGRSVFDGCLPLLEMSRVISVEEVSGELRVNFNYRNIVYSEQMCQQKLLESFLEELKEDENFHRVFQNSHFDYLEHKSIVIDLSAFTLQYSNMRRLLMDFDFLRPHPSIPNKLIINSKWKKYFDVSITPKVRKLLGVEELKKRIEQQELSGEEAERFVLSFENKRLNGKEGVEWVAPYDSGAGFDILSFHTDGSDEQRLIEVKSYAGDNPYFYWSRNEMNTAEQHMENYFIYLVNREKVSNPGYTPEMISNPIKNILENQKSWVKNIEKYYISYLKSLEG